MLMKKILHIVFLTSITAFTLLSCRKEPALSPESVIFVPSQEQNEFDKWLEANFVNPYNIEFKYRFELSESNLSYYSIPADYWSCVKMAHLVKYSCVDSYDEVAGIQFTRTYFPKQFYLLGEWQYKNNGSYTLGTAEGGKKIFLAGINLLPQYLGSADELNQYYIKTIHHEFTHILNQTKDYPVEFKSITGTGYVADSWNEEPYESNHLQYGFITDYSQYSEDEDFAEMLSEYITHDETWWNSQLQLAGDAGQLIASKLDVVRDYMYDTFNIDIDVLRSTVLRRQNEVFAGHVDLHDITVK